MTWEKALLALFDDLEQQAEGLALSARDAEVAEHVRAEYASVDLESRIHGSVGCSAILRLRGGSVVTGTVARAGAGWCLVRAGDGSQDNATEWVVVLAALVAAAGLGPRAVGPAGRGVAARLGVGSVLRRLAEARDVVVLLLVEGDPVRGQVGRVGADFVELVRGGGELEVVPLAAVAALRRA